MICVTGRLDHTRAPHGLMKNMDTVYVTMILLFSILSMLSEVLHNGSLLTHLKHYHSLMTTGPFISR